MVAAEGAINATTTAGSNGLKRACWRRGRRARLDENSTFQKEKGNVSPRLPKAFRRSAYISVHSSSRSHTPTIPTMHGVAHQIRSATGTGAAPKIVESALVERDERASVAACERDAALAALAR